MIITLTFNVITILRYHGKTQWFDPSTGSGADKLTIKNLKT